MIATLLGGVRALAPGVPATSTPTPTPMLVSIDASGWSGVWNTAFAALPTYSTGDTEFSPETDPKSQSVSSDGFTSLCVATKYTRPLISTKRLPQPYTGASNTHLLGDPNGRVALSGYAFATCVPSSGCTNNSTAVSFPSVVQWADRNRQVLGDNHRSYFRAYHWSGTGQKPIAGGRVWFRSTDGTKRTAYGFAVGVADLPGGNDRFLVQGYYADVDTSQWSDGTPIPDGTELIREGDAYPWIGVAASVKTTVGGTVDGRGWAPGTFLKHTARATNKPIVCVDIATGVDAVVLASGVTSGGAQKVSTSAATARANPFATIKSATEALKAATAITGGFTDGCLCYLGTGTHALTQTAAGTYQTTGEYIIEADPTVSAAGVYLTLSSVSLRQSWATYRNLNLVRSGALLLSVLSGRPAIVNCTLDNNSQNSAFWTGGPLYIDGLTIANHAASVLTSGTNAIHLMRGVKAGVLGGAQINVDAFNMTGCDFINAVTAFGGRDPSGGISDFYANMGCTGTAFSLAVSGVTQINGYARVQFVEEGIGTVSNPISRPSSDSETLNIDHYVEWYRTPAGASLYFRDNEGYDETVGTLRTHRQWSQVGCIPVTDYTKHDWFIGTAGGASAAEAQTHINGWSVRFKVNAQGNLHQFITDSGYGPNYGPNGDRSPAYFGLGAKWPAKVGAVANQYARLDPQFVGGATKATQYNGTTVTAGTGGVATDYRLMPTSPAKGMVTDSRLPKDLGGNARPMTGDSAGAWV